MHKSKENKKFWHRKIFDFIEQNKFIKAYFIGMMIYALIRPSLRFLNINFQNMCENSIFVFNVNETIECAPYLTFVSLRVASWNSAHVWAWLIIGCSGLFITFYPRPINALRGILFTSFLVFWHEDWWYIAYFTHNWNSVGLYTFVMYSPFIMFVTFLGALFYYSKYWKTYFNYKLWFILNIFWIIRLFTWQSIGFPTTLDLMGKTIYYENPIIDLLEFDSWISLFIIFITCYLSYNLPKSLNHTRYIDQ